MSKPVIADIIERDALKPGDAMRTLGGVEIEGSRVLDDRTVVYPDRDDHVLATVNLIAGTTTEIRLSPAAMAQLLAHRI